MSTPVIDDQFLDRYSRQLLLSRVGLPGQLTLLDKTVMIVGAGGLGCSNALYLAASGVGRLIIVDMDTVSASNLPRQILFSEDDIGKHKASCVAKRLQTQFPCEVIAINQAFTAELLTQYAVDLLIDAGDNLALTEQLAGCGKTQSLPIVHASVIRHEGHVYVYQPDRDFPSLPTLMKSSTTPDTCSQAGVLTTAVAVVATLQAHQAIRVLLAPRLGELQAEWHWFDGIQMRCIPIKLPNISSPT